MARFTCRYVSNGAEYECMLEAPSADAAAERMRRLRWAPGCGPIGRPRRVNSALPWPELAAVLTVVAAIGLASLAVDFAKDDAPQIAAVVAAGD